MKKRNFFIVFIAINFLLSVFYIDTWDNGNTASRMLTVMYAVNEGTFQIDKQHEKTVDKSFINGHHYSDKAPLPSFLVMPFYKLLRMAGYEEDGQGKAIYILGSIICGVIPFLIILAICYKTTAEKSSLNSVLLCMLPLYGSFIFIYAGTFYNHLLSALLLLSSYLLLKKENYFLSGILIGLGFLSEFTLAFIFPIWVLQIFFSKKNFFLVLKFVAGIMPCIVLIMIYNFNFTGSVFTMLYKFHNFFELHSDYGFSHPTFESLWGLTFSQYKGLFFYCPSLVLFFFYETKNISQISLRKILLSNSIMPSLISVLLISSYFGWWGGWAYGPRLILFTAVLLVYKGIKFLSGQNFSNLFFWMVSAFGILCTFCAKITIMYSIPTEAKFPFTEIIFPSIKSGNFNTSNLASMLFEISPVISAIAWVLLFVSSLVFLTIYSKKISSEI